MTGFNRVQGEEYRFDNCVVRSDTRELLRDGMPQKIERRTFDLILYLIKLEGRVASKDELLEHVWGNHYVSDSVIAQSIMKARKALGISGKEDGPIKTIHRVGYRFVRPVQRLPGAAFAPQEDRPAGAASVIWLPTECASPKAGVSWVRYGLISVASAAMEGHGVSVAPAGEAIRLCESAKDDNPAQAIAHALRDQGQDTGVIGSQLSGVAGHYQLDWQLYLDDQCHANRVKGESPAEMALVAAQEIAFLARLHALQASPLSPSASFWAHIDALLTLAESLNQVDRMAPLLAQCAELPQCPVRVLAALVEVLAQRTDRSTPGMAERLSQRARQSCDSAYEGWARLCLAKFHLYVGEAAVARQQAMGALDVLRRHASGALLSRGLMLATHVLGMLGQHGDAQALLREAQGTVDTTLHASLSCEVQLRRCELAYLRADIAATGQPFQEALELAQRLGFQSTESWLRVFCAMQCLAAGRFTDGHQHLEAAREASEQRGVARALIYATLQTGCFHARNGDRAGLEQCLSRLGDPQLRDTALGTAAWRWLRARHLVLSGQARDAFALAEQAMRELAHLGLWWGEDNWLFMAQVALLGGHRAMADNVLGELEARQLLHPAAPRRAVLLAVQGMLAHHDGAQAQAHRLFEQAHELARHTLMAQVLLPGLVWLSLVNGRQPGANPLAAAGDWAELTPEGRHVQAVVLRQSQWGDALQQTALMLGTGTDNPVPVVAEAGDAALIRYMQCLPLPV